LDQLAAREKAMEVAKSSATTGTGGTVGQVPVVGLTAATGKVLVSMQEDPGAGLLLSHVVASNGFFTVFTKDTATATAAALDSKMVAFEVVSL
jgi:hypothetical protein